LAGFYETGANGLPVDSASAAKWYGKAAAHGDLGAALTLVRMYEQGRGVGRDRVQASIWRTQAAGLGDAASALKVGKSLAAGRAGFARDDLQAYVFLSLAAIRYDSFGDRGLKGAAAARDEVGPRLTRAQREEAERMIEALKVRFVGDGEKWTWQPKRANVESEGEH
jgi:TPR repeat protein